jgi:hypothetical protein
MPQYEYECDEDGEVLTLLRPMSEADAPVEDPESRGRVFSRRHSVFGVGRRAAAQSAPAASTEGFCPCGMRPGGCGGS